MAVGVVTGKIAVVQPEDALGAQCFRQQVFNTGSIHGRIAGRRQQAFAGGQQGAFTIGFDRASLENEVDRYQRCRAKAAKIRQVAVQGIVLFPREFSAPGIEPEIQ